MANLNGYVKASEVMGAAAQEAGDPAMGKVGRTRYLSFFQQGLTLMAMDTPFDKRYVEMPVPEDRKVPLPQYMAGIDNIYLFNGDGCDICNRVPVFIKENFNHKGGLGAFENNPGGFANDGYFGFGGDYFGWDPSTRVYVAGVRDGVLYLGRRACAWANIRIEYSGLGFEKFCQEEELRAPMWAREALTDYVAMKALEHRMWLEGKENVVMVRWKDKKEQYTSPFGSWMSARARWSSMDHKDMQDVIVYMTGLGGQMF